MATNVSHRLPTPQDQAIADLTGYEDAATLRWQQACVQAANTLTALPNGRYVTVRMERTRQGLELAQRGAVSLPEDGEDLSAVVRSGSTLSQVDTHRLTCTCTDYQKHLQACKHLLAAEIHIGALGLLGPKEARDAQHAAPAPDAVAGSLAGAQLQLANPAGCTLKFRMGAHELWFTFHDTSDDALLARLRTTLPLLHEIVEACAQHAAPRTPAGEPVAEPPSPPAPSAPPACTLDEQMAATVQAAFQTHGAASRNGQRPPPSAPQEPPARDPAAAQQDKDPSWCARHDVTMTWHDGNARGPGWFSHRLADGRYCKGT